MSIIIRRTIYKTKTFDQFVAMMQAQGYKVIKGRGISFIDNKKVKIKGSEVGYSLAIIERNLFALHQLKTDRDFFKQFDRKEPLKSSPNAIDNTSTSYANNSIANQFKNDISETIDALLKPEQIPEHVSPELLMKKKEKKKKRNLHI